MEPAERRRRSAADRGGVGLGVQRRWCRRDGSVFEHHVLFLAGGPQGHVAMGTHAVQGEPCVATGYVWDASGTPSAGPSTEVVTCGNASIGPVAFDRADHLLYGYENNTEVIPSPPMAGTEITGFVGESVNKTFSGSTSVGLHVFTDLFGADAAGNLFIQVETGAVIYSRVVQIPSLANGLTAGPVADGLGGISYAVQLPYQVSCACTTLTDCAPTGKGTRACNNGMCEGCTPQTGLNGNISVTRFAP